MNDTERLVVGAALSLLLFLAAAFNLHISPRFPGSLTGGMLGIAAATLMLMLLVYPVAKYSTGLKLRITRLLSMRALLSIHIYLGVVGGLLGILHTGHKYQSPLGIALVATMFVVIVTGFLGRYYLPLVSTGLRDQQSRLGILRSSYDRLIVALTERQSVPADPAAQRAATLDGVPIPNLVAGIADLEYAIGSREAVKVIFMRWIIVHVIVSILFYLLLLLHVAGQIYYGLRWLS